MIDEKLVQQAIKVLRSVNEKHYGDSSKKKPLLEDEKETTLYLQISLKKIPKSKLIQMIKVNLPHSLLKENSEVCLITGDLDKKNHIAEIEPDVLHYKELLKKHGINKISEVVTLRQLRTEYKPYEAKQKLLAAYDIFLADRKIAECLPKVLGRHFFKKRKFPIQITLNTTNLKQQVENAISTKVFHLTGHGNSCNSEVAHLDMSNKEISENVTAMAKAFSDKLPGSWNNVMGMYLKTSLSKAIPVYMSYDDPNKVQLSEEKDDDSYEIDELSTFSNSLVKVYKDGSVRVARIKRMAETEIDETADVCADSNVSKDKENISHHTDSSLTNLDNGESDKGKKKSISKKRLKECTLDLEKEEMKEEDEIKDVIQNSRKRKSKRSVSIDADEKNITCTGLKEEMKEEDEIKDVIQKSRKRKSKRSVSIDADEKNISCTGLKILEEMREDEAKDISQSFSRKKSKKSVSVDVDEKNIRCTTGLKGESSKISKKSKNARKSEGNVLIRGMDVTSTDLKEKLHKKMGKPKSKRTRAKNLLSDGNGNVTHLRVQAAEKKKDEENLKRPLVKGKRKGKQKKKCL